MKKPKKATVNRDAQKWMNELWDQLASKLAKTNSEKEVKDILGRLVSDYEKTVILKRLGALTLVKSGLSYKKISEILWLSPNTISTIKKNALGNNGGYKSYRLFYGGPIVSGEIKFKKSKTFWDGVFDGVDLWDLLTNPPRPTGMGLRSASKQNRKI